MVRWWSGRAESQQSKSSLQSPPDSQNKSFSGFSLCQLTPASLLFLCLVIAIAFGLRVANLNHLPLSLSLDEATNGLDALQLFRLKWLTPFLQNNFGRETLFFYGQAVALSLYGISFFSLRFASVLVATLTIPLLYAVGRRLQLDNLLLHEQRNTERVSSRTRTKFDRPPLDVIGLLAATGLAISYWHIYFSRLGLRAILLLPLTLGLIWCFWRGWFYRTRGAEASPLPPCPSFGLSLRTKPAPRQFFRGNQQLVWLVVAGVLLGLTFYTYLAARLLPVLFVIFVIVELVRNKSTRKEKSVHFLVLFFAAALVATPLAFYFLQNPQALSSRTQAISIFATGAPLDTLVSNLTALLRIHFLAGTWLEEWPALNLLSALGLLLGLPVCLFHLRKPAFLFLLLWWLIGTAPVLISEQDWNAPTVPLRGIVAWPALFLISAIGLTTPVRILTNRLAHYRVARYGRTKTNSPLLRCSPTPLLLSTLLLIFGGLNSAHNYFWVWAADYNDFSDHPAYMAHYLNSQTNQLTLTPLMFYGETVVNFLLQARYPTLTNIDAATLRSMLESGQPAVYLLPARSTAESIFVLLAPTANGQGTAYLLPPLSLPQTGALSKQTRATSPLAAVLDGEQEPIANVYPLSADAPFLPVPLSSADEKIEAGRLQSIQASFNQDVLLSSYRVEPAVIKPGDTVTLSFNWQAQRPIDGDYNLFIHLFNVPQGQRYGQINTPLTGVLFDAHRWPVGLTVPDIHYFTLPADAPQGPYRFEVGLYHAASLQRLPVTIETAVSTSSPDDKVILGKFHLWQQSPAPPQVLLSGVEFGNVIALLGADLPAAPVQPGQTLTYTLHWQALARITQDYTVFTHLLDSEGKLQAQQDRAPQRGRYPTSWWDPGEIIIDPYSLLLPKNLASGQYTLRVGLYRPETGQRLPLKNQTRDFVDLPNLITVSQVAGSK